MKQPFTFIWPLAGLGRDISPDSMRQIKSRLARLSRAMKRKMLVLSSPVVD